MSISTKKILYSYIGINEENKNSFFKDRKCELKNIEKILSTKQFVHLYGVQGCGKSALASKYALNKFNDDQFVVCWFSEADRQKGKFELKIIKLLKELEEKPTQNYNQRAELQRLNELNSNELINLLSEKINKNLCYLQFLFILDNLKDEEFLMNIHLKFKNNVKFIVTSVNKLNDFKCDSVEICRINHNNTNTQNSSVIQNQQNSTINRSSLLSCFPDTCCKLPKVNNISPTVAYYKDDKVEIQKYYGSS